MAIPYPLSTADLWKLCHFSSYSWDLGLFDGSQQRQDGGIISSRHGTPKWMGSGELRQEARISDSVTFMAKFGKVRGSLGSFLAYDQRRPYPLSDPLGAALVGFTPTLYDIGVDRDRIRLANLPSSFVITAGDYISIPYTDVTSKYCLVRAIEGATAVAGTTPLFYIEDQIPLIVPEGGNVILAEPPCICKIVPGSIRNPTNDSGTASGLSFSWIQDR